jgi:hypothetical protein
MLNGRVYGARKNQHLSTNMFQNIPDEEPEFVEWGFGGMGSVRSGGMWSKVQSDQKNFLGHTEDRGRRGAPQAATADDDDGGGMGWVKKRREERERKKREELAASEAGSEPDVGSAAPTPVSATVPVQGAAHDTILVSVDHEITTVTPLQPGTGDDDESSEEDDGEVDDESSSTEQEGDDGDQVRDSPSSVSVQLADGMCRISISSKSWVRAWSASAAIIANNYAYLISAIRFDTAITLRSPHHRRRLILCAIPTTYVF